LAFVPIRSYSPNNSLIVTRKALSPFFASGVICIVMGIMAWSRFIIQVTSGDLDLFNFETLLFPIGIGLLGPGPLWVWIGRFQLFLLALYSGVLIFGYLFMSAESQFLVFEFNVPESPLSGPTILFLLHTGFFVGTLWLYFSIFASGRKESPPFQIHTN